MDGFLEEDEALFDGEDYVGGDDRRHRRGEVGPQDVTFSVCLDRDEVPKPGESIYISGSCPELALGGPGGPNGVQLNPCRTGDGRLWTTTVVLDIKGAGGGAASAAAGAGPGGMLSMLGGMGGIAGFGGGGLSGSAAPLLFTVSYSLVNAAGKVLKKDEKPQEEHGSLKHNYYHRTRFQETVKDENDAESFPLFVHDEILLLQTGETSSKDFLNRFLQLAQAPFAKKRSLLDKALEELINVHWGKGVKPPTMLVLAVAATYGHFRKQQHAHPGDWEHYGHHFGTGMGAYADRDKQEKDKEPPPSLVVCNWIVSHCPSRQELEDETKAREAAENVAAAADGGGGHRDRRRGRDYGSDHQMKRLYDLGVLQAAETLYFNVRSFEWLKLISFLPEHQLPNPVSSSTVNEEKDRDRLEKNFLETMTRIFEDTNRKVVDMRRRDYGESEAELKEKKKNEEELDKFMQLFLGGLAKFSPSVDCLNKMLKRAVENKMIAEHAVQIVAHHFLSRLRSLNFGQRDKDALRATIKEFQFLAQTDDIAVSLLTNSHHPSQSFQDHEIIGFAKQISESQGMPRPAGHQLQQAVKRWLNRHFAQRSGSDARGKDDKYASQMSSVEYQQHKDEIRGQIQNAIKGWLMVLQIPCFRMEEECLRLIVFELTQASFFKDPEHMLVLDAILELEDDIDKTKAVQHLQDELHRCMVRLIRDCNGDDYYEAVPQGPDYIKLLDLLYQKPTPLRFNAIEALINMKQANPAIKTMMQHQEIWRRLLSRDWLNSKTLANGRHHLRNVQLDGQRVLKETASQLGPRQINLHDMHVITDYKTVYEDLVKAQESIDPNTLKAIPDNIRVLRTFDTELNQLKSYVKLHCNLGNVQADALAKKTEDITKTYNSIPLSTAEKSFVGMPIREHLDWLFQLRGSDVFAGIWKTACGVDEERIRQGEVLKPITQEQVVGEVIPKAKKTWEDLSKSIENGKAILKDIKWAVDYDWVAVDRELGTLESTAPKAGMWKARGREMCLAMRLAAKLRQWAPAMLHLKQVLKDLFKSPGSDECVQEFENVVKSHEAMWEMELGQIIDLVKPFRNSINQHQPDKDESVANYVIAMASHDKSIEYLLTHSDLDGFNRLIALVRPNTDDNVVLSALASLQQSRTFLSETLYSKPPYGDLRSFHQQMATLFVDESMMNALGSIQTHFEPLQQLLVTQQRSPGIQALHDLIKITDTGVFSVKCTIKNDDQIACQVDGKKDPYSYEELSEMRRQLLMTDIPAEGLEDNTKENIEGRLTELVEKFNLLEQFGRYSTELLNLGHFAYSDGQVVFEAKPKESVVNLQKEASAVEQKLNEWTNSIEQARGDYYYLNYFTVREICHMVRSMDKVSTDEGAWQSVWPLLRCISPNADMAKVKSQIIANPNLKKCGTGVEVNRLNAMGAILGETFSGQQPIVRKLDGIKLARQVLQGDLTIRSMQSGEQGTPVFVCIAEAAPKVTELILSIYTRRERVPEAEELLMCSGSTSLEQIELLLWRFFKARKNGREDRLYSLGNIHLLPYVVQCGTVETLRRLEDKFGYQDASALVFVSGLQNQMLTNALNRHNIAVSVLPSENLRDAVKKIGETYHGRPMEAVSAKMNGMGKTHHILRNMAELQEQHGGAAIRHHIEIRETTDIAMLVESLLRDPTDPKIPTAIHIDLAHILPMYVDTLLFEVLVVGMLRDPTNCAVYHRRTMDFFFVEIPNTPQENTAQQLSFCLLIPRIYMQMSADRIDPEMPEFQRVGDTQAHKVTFVKNTSLALVGKTLEAMKKEAFNPKAKDFQVTWKAATVPEIDKERTYELLFDVCCSETSPPSFLVFMNFVRFMGELIRMAEGWNMMNLQLLQNFDPGLKHFKHCFYRLLIETSRDFALRQVPKGHMELQSPLRPRLTRQNTGERQTPTLGRELSTASTRSGRPAMNRMASGLNRTVSTQSHQPTTEEVETGGVGRVEASTYAQRFDQMPAWESMIHPIASFKKNEQGTIIGCNIMSLSKDFLGSFIDRNLQNSLNLNDLKLEKDWTKVTHQEAVQLVHQVEGGELLKRKDHLQGPKDYVVTVDNLLKLMSIQQRLRFGLPVILMGETGCGKTALVKFLASTLDFQLFTLDVHGGITDDQIIQFMDHSSSRANEQRGALVFFDEINAANCMAIFKSIIVDRVYGNKVVPANVRIISCCNPYSLRQNVEDENMALTFQAHGQEGGAASGITDPMKKLVYRVHPLPESLIDIVSDFGSLSEASEELYISAILKKELPRYGADDETTNPAEYDAFMEMFKTLLCQSQSFVREQNNGERSVVSMRDIVRASSVFKWFLKYYSQLRGEASPVIEDMSDGVMRILVDDNMRPHLRCAVILTLGYCYHARLNRNHRWGYRKKVCDTWRMNTQAKDSKSLCCMARSKQRGGF
jgi:hypothetical protein